jgi:aminopeptidase N
MPTRIDVQHYIFKVELNDNNDSIRCTATIRFKFLTATEKVSLDLVSRRNDGKGMLVRSVTENETKLAYSHSNNILNVALNVTGRINDEKTIQVQYDGIPADGLIISKNKYDHRTFFTDHWPNRASHWLPCIDRPSDKASVEFMVTAPVHYQVIANGIMIEETNVDGDRKFTHYKETVPLPMKIAAIGVADFAVRYEGSVGNIPVHSWVYPEDRIKGFHDYSLAIEMFPFFIKNIAPYPYKKLANIQSNTIFQGMENAGAIFYSENSITGERSVEVLMAHEIAHQWFGDMATEADWSHVWLSEGFATYMAILYMENTHGADTANKMRLEDRGQAIAFSKQKTMPVVDSTTTKYLELLNANSYQKGSWVLHMLRKQLGDSLFWKGTRNYYTRYAGKNATTDNLRTIMESTSGKDLKSFFKQWLYTPGHPVLDIKWKYNHASKLITINIRQQQDSSFEFPLELGISIPGKTTQLKSLIIKDKQTSFSIPVTEKPSKIDLDPGVNLFFEGEIKETR